MSSDVPQRPLEQMGISPETTLPEGALTPAKVKSIRFSQTRPGYHYGEVEEFVEQVQVSFDMVAKILHNRDLDVHALDEALARAQVDLRNKNNQIEVLVAKEGIEVAGKEDAEFAALLEANDRLKNELDQKNNEFNDLKEKFETLNIWAEEAEEYINSHPDIIETDYIEPEVLPKLAYGNDPETEVEILVDDNVNTSQNFNFPNTSTDFDFPKEDGNQKKLTLPPGIRADDLE